MNVPLCAPDYTCVSKRASIIKVAYRLPPKGQLTDLVIDSTGLKVLARDSGRSGNTVMTNAGSGASCIWR